MTDVAAAVGSPLAGVRARLAEKQRATTTVIDLPAELDGELAVRYSALGWEDGEKVRDRYDRSEDPRARVLLWMDHLIHACDAICVREDGKWVALEEDGRKVRFGAALANALEIPDAVDADGTPDTHAVCRGVFAAAAGGLGKPPDGVTPEEHWRQALKHADHLLEAHHAQYSIWLKAGVGEIEEEMLGE